MVRQVITKSRASVYIRFRNTGKLFNIRSLRAHTKVLETLLRELLYADDCAMISHYAAEIQELCNCFTDAANDFGLSVNVSKAEVLYQRPLSDCSNLQEAIFTINGSALK